MLNAQEAQAAIKNLTYSSAGTKEERNASHVAYRNAVSDISDQFAASLAANYASDLPSGVQRAIWNQAWENGHSSGYGDVEAHYIDLADFTRTVRNI